MFTNNILKKKFFLIQYGLHNIFMKAGPIDEIKIIPPKDQNHFFTYG